MCSVCSTCRWRARASLWSSRPCAATSPATARPTPTSSPRPTAPSSCSTCCATRREAPRVPTSRAAPSTRTATPTTSPSSSVLSSVSPSAHRPRPLWVPSLAWAPAPSWDRTWILALPTTLPYLSPVATTTSTKATTPSRLPSASAPAATPTMWVRTPTSISARYRMSTSAAWMPCSRSTR